MIKRCKRCEGVFSLDAFHKDRREKDGHVAICKECAKAKTRAWNAVNTKRKREVCREYYRKNSVALIEQATRRKRENRPYVNTLARLSYALHPEESRQKAKERMQKWRSQPHNNRHEQERRNAQWKLNPGERARKLRDWRLRHPELAKAQVDRRRALRRGATRSTLTAKEWAFIKKCYNSRCAYCDKKQARLTQDHIIPLSRGGTHTIDNVIPACQSCNSKKHTGPPLKPVQPLLGFSV